MIGLIVTFVVAASLAWMVWHIVKKYRETDGKWYERLLAGARDSATIMWGYFLWAAGGLMGLAEKTADLLNMPEVTNFIHTSLPPNYVAYGLMAIGVVTIIARLRTL